MMQSNVAGRVKHTRLPQAKYLWPVLECIVNSIHAIQDSGRHDGQIRVHVIRDIRQEELDLAERAEKPIIGFRVWDNGQGFTNDNFSSFALADSDFKQARGAKGVGRFVWLKAFRTAKIESVFASNGKRFKRNFLFQASREGIHDHEMAALSDEEAQEVGIYSQVVLEGFSEPFQRVFPKRTETIAAKILTHLLIFFLKKTAPKIFLSDDGSEDTLILNDLFEEQIAPQIETLTCPL